MSAFSNTNIGIRFFRQVQVPNIIDNNGRSCWR